jgi:hypothetical protein
MLTKEITFTERNQNNSELSVTCEAAGCYSKATDKIVVNVGNLHCGAHASRFRFSCRRRSVHNKVFVVYEIIYLKLAFYIRFF